MVRETVEDYVADRGPMMGAAIAFYTVLALAPLLVLAVGIAGLAFGEASARTRMESWLRGTLDGAPAEVAVQFLESASAPVAATLPGLLGLGIAVYYAGRLFLALQHALNQIWNVQERTPRGVRMAVSSALRKRAGTFVALLAFGLLLLVSLAFETALPAIARSFSSLPGAWFVYRALVLIGSVLAMGLGVAVIYRLLPSVRIPWKYLWGGSMLTGTLLVAGKFLLGLYLGSGALETVPGAAGSVFALLLWTYYSAQVFLFGAELTQVAARQRGHPFGRPPAATQEPPPPS